MKQKPYLYKNLNILVVGDIILDETIYVEVNRISPEAPVLVANKLGGKIEAGGAANVALNVVNTGVKCGLMGFIGAESKASTVIKQLKEFGVKDLLIKKKNSSSILKTRVTEASAQLIRLDEDTNFDEFADDIIARLRKYIKNFDAVIVSDYGKGTVTESVFREIITLSKLHGFKIIVDPKGDHAEKYKGATTITPNKKEFEIFVGKANGFCEMAKKGQKLMEKLNLEFLLVTMSEEGMLLITPNGEYEHIPTAAKEVYDVTGAGDTVVAIFSAVFLASGNLVYSAKIANSAAGVVVARRGPAKISKLDFARITEVAGSSVLSLSDLDKFRSDLGKIVMTNGCFDLLHRGHIEYLNRAKTLGDTLIVALNSDESVKALKGHDRPVNTLEDRALVLKNLKAVDFVITFDELTPLKLYRKIVPDVLVKGGDYELDQIVGREIVEENGGTVVSIKFIDNYSTTKMLRKIINIDGDSRP